MLFSNSYNLSEVKLSILLICSGIVGTALSYGDLYLFHIILFFSLVVWLYKIKNNDYRLDLKVFSSNYILVLIIFYLWYLLSLFWTPSIELGIKYIFYISCGLILTVSVVSISTKEANLNKLFKLFSLLFISEIIIALLEVFTNFRMPTSSLSTFAPFFGKDSTALYLNGNLAMLSNLNAPTGFRWNTNDLAVSMIIILPFFLCHKKIAIKFFGIGAISIIIVMTASRAVFIALIITFCIYLIMIKKRFGTLLIAWTFLVSLFWAILNFSDSDNPRINEIANSLEALSLFVSGDIDVGGSIQWRRKLVENGFEALSNSYGFGIGAGGTVANQENIGPVSGRFTSMHNFWIEVLVEGGIIIGLLISLWYINIIYNLFKVSRSSASFRIKYYSQSLILSMVAFVPAAIAASSTVYFLPMWIMFGFSISIILFHRENNSLFIK